MTTEKVAALYPMPHQRQVRLLLGEEFLLLMVDEKSGRMRPLALPLVNCIMAAAVLMDLMLVGRLDNDLDNLFVVDPTPIPDEILDPLLMSIAEAPVLTPFPIDYWVRRIAENGIDLRNSLLQRLQSRGLLHVDRYKTLGLFSREKFLPAEAVRPELIAGRLEALLKSNTIPEARDIMLLAMASACGLLGLVLPADMLKSAEQRISQLSRIEIVGQVIASAIERVQIVVAAAAGYR